MLTHRLGRWAQPSLVATLREQPGTRTHSSLPFKQHTLPPHHLLAKHPPHLPKLQAYSHLSSCLQPPGEVLVFPAQPDSAQSPGIPVPLLRCRLWFPSGRRLGVPTAFPLGPANRLCTLSSAPTLFLLFTYRGKGDPAGPWPLARSASRLASSLCAGRCWDGSRLRFWGALLRVVAGGWNSFVIPPGGDKNIWRAAGEH